MSGTLKPMNKMNCTEHVVHFFASVWEPKIQFIG